MSHYNVHVVVSGDTQAEADYAVEDALAPYSQHLEVEPYAEELSQPDVEWIVEQANLQRLERQESLLDPARPSDTGEVLAAVSEWIGLPVTRGPEGTLTYTSMTNPDGRWDYWVTGGRWQGAFALRGGYRSDLARVGDVDLSLMRDRAAAAAGAKFDCLSAGGRGTRGRADVGTGPRPLPHGQGR